MLTDIIKHMYLIIIFNCSVLFDVTFKVVQFKCSKLLFYHYKCVITNIFKYMACFMFQVSTEIKLKYSLVYHKFSSVHSSLHFNHISKTILIMTTYKDVFKPYLIGSSKNIINI